MSVIEFFVPGTPRPQGSKRHVGGGRMIESSKYLKAWRNTVTLYAIAHRPIEPISGAVDLALTFHMPRPASHYGTGRNATRLRASAPDHHTSKPDASKLLRAVEDALTDAHIWVDDSQVTSCGVVKQYATGEPGVSIVIWTAK